MDFGKILDYKFYLTKRKGDVAGKFAKKFARKLKSVVVEKTKGFTTKATMNGKVYQEKCLQKRILPFDHSKVRSSSGLTWKAAITAGMTSNRPLIVALCNNIGVSCCIEGTKWSKENKINFIGKNINPPNCPDFRSIESY